jgi:hypothetical protein
LLEEQQVSTKTLIVDGESTLRALNWADYVTAYHRETSKEPALDMKDGLDYSLLTHGGTLENVLEVMNNEVKPGPDGKRVLLLYAHGLRHGLYMRVTDGSNSAVTAVLEGLMRTWSAMQEVMRLRDGKWPAPGETGQPVFTIDVPKAVAKFRELLTYLRQLIPKIAEQIPLSTPDASLPSRLPNPETVTNRAQADAWFDQWVSLMSTACLGLPMKPASDAPAGESVAEMALRRVCRLMQHLHWKKFDRVEIRGCNIGAYQENLDVLRQFFGAREVLAPKVTMFFGKIGINTEGPGFEGVERNMGGYRGEAFRTPVRKNNPKNNFPITPQLLKKNGWNIEKELLAGQRNRILTTATGEEVLLQLSELAPFVYKGRLEPRTDKTVADFFAEFYGPGFDLTYRTEVPVGGMWTPNDTAHGFPFVLPRENRYGDLIERSR